MIKERAKKIAEYLFCLLIFLLPWSTRWIYLPAFLNGQYWEYGTLSLYVTELFFAVLAIFVIGIFWSKIVVQSSDLSWSRIKRQDKLVLLFIVYLLFNLWLSLHQAISWQYFTWLLQGMAMFYLWRLLSNIWQKANYSLLAAGLVQSTLAIWQFLEQRVSANKWLGMAEHLVTTPGASVVEGAGRFLRAYGSFSHPNILGGFLALVIIVNIYWLWRFYQQSGVITRSSHYRQVIHYLFLVSSLMISSYALCLTFARSAWLALGVGLIFLAITTYRRQSKVETIIGVKILITILLVIVLFISVNSQLFFSRFSGQSRLEVMSNQQRYTALVEVKSVIVHNLLLGVGLGNYTTYGYWLNQTHAAWDYQPAHNLYLLVWSEIGLIGLLILLGFILLVIKSLWPIDTVEKRIKLCLAITLLLIGLFDHYWWSLYNGIIIWWLAWGWINHANKE
ncbi:MAG: hypothetical protein COX77_04955 [Candidatus Komeilibacteria bacterium CG_4_10_14_0_2_um_filter_37_10]|uniref:O-antigen ligase-related domain-containing protein n=1 Tax=Candidatus Komeilibacteria bacterium CG_4_10_14_0_2_um_filter_37_10 TaxID=1974470 RepID=A0A2M7VD30_9BACT|nr:MAG: hypothetical protein COX77_04955 [Candidatus Komeilibacteria bacterium CG_4_10_14_0_2_um_filter_37_10]